MKFNEPVKFNTTCLIASLVLLLMVGTGMEFPPDLPDNDHVFRVIKKMVTAFDKIENLTCETEVHYYDQGEQSDYYWIKYSYNQAGLIRVDFFHPYNGLIVFYQDGADRLTVKPFQSIPMIKVKFSIDNELVKTPSGQRIDQTDIRYFLKFIIKNHQVIEQHEHSVNEDSDKVILTFWAMDYITGKNFERYIFQVSKKNRLPILIERYSKENKLIEYTTFKNHLINIPLVDDFFTP
jgi:hypothetical protein